MNRDEFFAELDRLTEKDIEVRLPQWDREQLLLVQEYLEQRRSKVPPADEVARAARDAASAAAEMASKANARATVAFIISVGAMLAAIASAAAIFLTILQRTPPL
jgi:hypothetical protein